MHHIGILYNVASDRVDQWMLKTERDGEDSLGASWIDIAMFTENNATPFVQHVLGARTKVAE